ncbi:MAG: hypothetical protein JWN60_1263 [Acidobacteria bacterium]|jgi:hypothetical protein|nr:hypothetical protein [Acidobacteriota bacterium]
MQGILERTHIARLITTQTENEFGARIGIIGTLFGCWHKELSRPFTNRKSSYRTCLHCGARKRFDAENLKTFGPFYYPPVIAYKEK